MRKHWPKRCSLALVAAPLLLSAASALEWQAGPGFRMAPLVVPLQGKTGFSLLPSSVTGIHFTNHLSDEKAAENQIRLLGSGVALGDIDGDG